MQYVNLQGSKETGEADEASRARIAVLLPCFNEGPAIGQVVLDFRTALPGADVYVYDNNSTDDTVSNALAAGARIGREPMQGKGHVVRRMFSDIEAEIYVLADGDGTYDPTVAPRMIQLLVEQSLDMVVGARSPTEGGRAYRFGHILGNRFFTATVRKLFYSPFEDILSGYRVMSRRFVKSFPALATGFEIEAMLTVHALDLRLSCAEIEAPYRERPMNTASKLKTVLDGARILATIIRLFKEVHPFRFFGLLSAALTAMSLALGIPIVIEFLETGLVPRIPTAILATGLMLLAAIALTCGLIVDSVSRSGRELKRLHYQAMPGVRDAHQKPPATMMRRQPAAKRQLQAD